jgi:hypothetical protein
MAKFIPVSFPSGTIIMINTDHIIRFQQYTDSTQIIMTDQSISVVESADYITRMAESK